MSFIHLVQSILEIVLIAFVVWGVFHEDKLIKFEKNIFAHFRRRKLKVVKSAPLRYAKNDSGF